MSGGKPWGHVSDQMRNVVDVLATGEQGWPEQELLGHPVARRAAAAALRVVLDAVDELDRVFSHDQAPIGDEHAWADELWLKVCKAVAAAGEQ